jgi:hypothetical protein
VAELLHVTLIASTDAVPDGDVDGAVEAAGTLWGFGRFDGQQDGRLRFELDGAYDLTRAGADAREAGIDPDDEAAMTVYLRHWLAAQARDAIAGIAGARVDEDSLAEQPA